jgi:hypothetical protein
MGWFRSFNDAMNEEFIIGRRNIERYQADPSSLEDILAEQRSRGIGSARTMRQSARTMKPPQEPARFGLFEAIGAIGIGLVGASLLADRKDHGDL